MPQRTTCFTLKHLAIFTNLGILLGCDPLNLKTKTSAQFKIPSGYQILYALENHIGIFMDIFFYESARRIGDQNVLRKVDALMDWLRLTVAYKHLFLPKTGSRKMLYASVA